MESKGRDGPPSPPSYRARHEARICRNGGSTCRNAAAAAAAATAHSAGSDIIASRRCVAMRAYNYTVLFISGRKNAWLKERNAWRGGRGRAREGKRFSAPDRLEFFPATPPPSDPFSLEARRRAGSPVVLPASVSSSRRDLFPA